MKFSLFKRAIGPDGPCRNNFDLISVKWKNVVRFCLSWHPHEPKCRYGVYQNWGCSGLNACLNLPLLGDFSILR